MSPKAALLITLVLAPVALTGCFSTDPPTSSAQAAGECSKENLTAEEHKRCAEKMLAICDSFVDGHNSLQTACLSARNHIEIYRLMREGEW